MPVLNDAEGPVPNEAEGPANHTEPVHPESVEGVDPPTDTDRSPIAGCRLPSRRGGRRPGAGAPKGNLNGLKHGRRSKQFAEIGHLIAAGSPQVREALLGMARRSEVKAHKADEMAAELFARLFAHARDIAEGVRSPGPFAKLLREPKESSVDPVTDRLHADIKALDDMRSKKTGKTQTQDQGKTKK